MPVTEAEMDGAVFVVAPADEGERVLGALSAARLDSATGDVEAALALVESGFVPAVVVVDLAVGAGAVAQLIARAPGLAVLALCTDAADAAVLAAVGAGATGCVVRSAGDRDLADAVRRAAGGEVVFSPGLARVVLDAQGRGGASLVTVPRLTVREADVLRLVVEGLTARQIARRLVLSPRTVENHIQRTLRKLGLPGRAALVRYAIENGLA